MQRDTIHVVGAGLGGLTAAALLRLAEHPVVIHDVRGRPGGRATSDDREAGGTTFRFNQGPHALYEGSTAFDVLGALGIHPARTAPSVAGTVVRDGEAHVLPASPGSLLRTRLLGVRGKAQVGALLARIGRLRPTDFASTTVDEWVDGAVSDPVAQRLLHALVRLGAYADHPGEMSADLAVRLLQLGTTTEVAYVHGGWQTIVDALVALLDEPGVAWSTAPLRDLPDAAGTVVAVGTPGATARLLGIDLAAGPEATAACLDLGLRGTAPVRFALDLDRHLYLSEHSVAPGFAPPGHSHLALAQYLAPGTAPDRGALEDLARTLGVTDDSIATSRFQHRMVVAGAVPTAALGGEAGRPGVDAAGIPGVAVVGDWVGPDGHLADAVFASARAAVAAVGAHVAGRSVVR